MELHSKNTVKSNTIVNTQENIEELLIIFVICDTEH